MPFSFTSMNDLMAVFYMILLFVMAVVVLLLRVRLMKKIIIFFVAVILIISIPLFGHSDFNKKTKLVRNLNTLNIHESFAPDTDMVALKEIKNASHPLHIKRLSSVQQPFTEGTLFSDEVVEINHKRYKVRLACYLTPFTFTPFETWQINSITKIEN